MRRTDRIRRMNRSFAQNPHSLRRVGAFTSLLLVLALLFAQPLWAGHIHLDHGTVLEQCDDGNLHAPAVIASTEATMPAPAVQQVTASAERAHCPAAIYAATARGPPVSR